MTAALDREDRAGSDDDKFQCRDKVSGDMLIRSRTHPLLARELISQESIMVALSSEVEDVVDQVRSWPAQTRIALARRVLETLDNGVVTSPTGLKGPPSGQVLGLWNPSGTAPTDEECDAILAEELRRKHAS